MLKPESPQIIDQAIQGDQLAFRTLVDAHQRFVYSLAIRTLGERQEALDVTQETFIRLWKHLPEYRKEIKLTTWLYKIVSNLCLDTLRARGRKLRIFSRDDNWESVSDQGGADSDFQKSELIAVVKKLASLLTPKQQVIFVLRDLEELDVEEVCEALSVTKENVKSNLYYARQKMAELLSSYYQDKNIIK